MITPKTLLQVTLPMTDRKQQCLLLPSPPLAALLHEPVPPPASAKDDDEADHHFVCLTTTWCDDPDDTRQNSCHSRAKAAPFHHHVSFQIKPQQIHEYPKESHHHDHHHDEKEDDDHDATWWSKTEIQNFCLQAHRGVTQVPSTTTIVQKMYEHHARNDHAGRQHVQSQESLYQLYDEVAASQERGLESFHPIVKSIRMTHVRRILLIQKALRRNSIDPATSAQVLRIQSLQTSQVSKRVAYFLAHIDSLQVKEIVKEELERTRRSCGIMTEYGKP